MTSNNTTPDYKTIYMDILNLKFPDKKAECEFFLKKEHLSALDILKLNEKIFGAATHRETSATRQKYRSYTKADILEILAYQKKHCLCNSQLANHFKLSRNSVAKWKKMFSEKAK